MSLQARYRVRCDGPCGWWLGPSRITVPDPADAATFPGERAARAAAIRADWTRDDRGWFCPDCTRNPLGIVLPPPAGECTGCGHSNALHDREGCTVTVPSDDPDFGDTMTCPCPWAGGKR
jgi:hypothetical protein